MVNFIKINRILFLTLALLFLVSFVIAEDILLEMTSNNLSLLCLSISLVVLFLVYAVSENHLSVSTVFLFVFLLFHFGATFAFAFNLSIDESFKYIIKNYWPSEFYIKKAIYLSTIGVVSYYIGVLIYSFSNKRKMKFFMNIDINRKKYAHSIEFVGFFLVSFSLLLWFYKVISVGSFAILVGSYGNFLEKTRDSSLSVLYFFIGLGFVLLSVGHRGVFFRFGLILFGLFSLFGFPLGLRGEILFPATTAMAISAAGGFSISKRKILIFSLIVLCAIGGVRVLRQSGLSGHSVSISDFSPHHALMEMGGQIWSVAEMCVWSNQGEPYLLGGSFLAPFERAFSYVIPILERLPADQDHRLLQLALENRVSAIGFSPVAEGYRNFGIYGVILVMFLIGMVFGVLEGHLDNILMRSFAAILLFPLMIFIRNSFTPIPFQIVVGCSIIFVTALICLKKPESVRL